MTMDGVGSGRNLVWHATLVMTVVDFVDWFVVTILKDSGLAFMGVHAGQPRMMRFLGKDGWQDLGIILWDGVKMVLF